MGIKPACNPRRRGTMRVRAAQGARGEGWPQPMQVRRFTATPRCCHPQRCAGGQTAAAVVCHDDCRGGAVPAALIQVWRSCMLTCAHACARSYVQVRRARCNHACEPARHALHGIVGSRSGTQRA